MLTLADRLRPVDARGRFELVGRDADIIKIAGKRASLTGLTRELCAIPGVLDGVAFLPRPDARRIAALVVAPRADAEALRRQLALRVDAAFLPRPLVLVDALPRDAVGKLPMAALCAALTPRHVSQAPRRTLTGHAQFQRDHPALSGHFPGRPIVPAVLLLSAVADVLRTAGLRVIECAKAKFLVPVLPGQALEIRIVIDACCAASFEIVAAGRVAAAGSMHCVGEGDRT
jgi:3-hydroxymyristoyl/3-hydroxydecanoyl-(acyl carrier protein) dehydratase